jgi:lysozyme
MKFIDLSYWNNRAKPINFACVKDVQCLVHKVSQGTGYKDPTCLQRVESALNNGIKVGYYHFATINSKNVIPDAKAEALWFKKCLASLPKQNFVLALDIENNSASLSSGDLALWINTFMSVSECDTIYSYYSYLREMNNDGIVFKKDYDLWVAKYSNIPPRNKEFDSLGNLKYWQYSSKGTVFGIAGPVDLNIHTP